MTLLCLRYFGNTPIHSYLQSVCANPVCCLHVFTLNIYALPVAIDVNTSKKTLSVRTHGRCVNMVLLHGTCSISMKTLVNVTLENKLKKNSLLNLVLLLFLSYDDVAFK